MARPLNPRGGRPKVDYSPVEAWLRERLKDGPVAAETLIKDAASANIKESVLRLVKRRIGVASFQRERIWMWKIEESK
jgi:hypothetical protein